MARTSFPAGRNPSLLLQIRGDLELTGAPDLEQVLSEGKVNIYRNDQGQIVIEANDDAELRVPAQSSIVDAHVNGDAEVRSILGGVVFQQIDGDAEFADCGAVDVHMTKGDLELKRIRAGVRLGRVNGDVSFEQVSGSGSSHHIAGDFELSQCNGAFEFKGVAGDVEINTLDGNIEIDSAAGDLSARAVSGVLGAQNVGGDLNVDGAGSFVSRNIGGDAVLRDIRDDISIGQVGGDFSSGGALLLGNLALNVGGDAVFALAPKAGDTVVINAGGDVRCNIGPNASAEVSIMSSEGRQMLHVGDGAASVRITAGGEVSLTGAEDTNVRREVKMDGRFKMGKFKVKLPKFGMPIPPIPPIPPMPSMPAFPPMPQMPQMPEFRWGTQSPPPQSGPIVPVTGELREDGKVIPINATPVSDEERKIILRMLAEKKITVEQADQLLSALE
jgi:hypothetical protein